MKNYEWLFDDISVITEKIRFKDRIEFRNAGKLHNEYGSALIKITEKGIVEEYYLKGIKLEYDEWNIFTRKNKLEKIIEKLG